VCSAGGNVVGLMPHPERASEPVLGSADGLRLFESAAAWVSARRVAEPAASVPLGAAGIRAAEAAR
jgi:hypothetical protein